jgi:hypothetical protein
MLLQVVGAQQGPTGTGKLAAATYIQRVHTEGGSAPPTACPSIGARTFVPYAADYVFYEGWPRGSRDPD